MPFTLAHPAAALPLRRVFSRLDVIALVVGSMMPDLPYMTLVGPAREATHTLAATLWFCVPTGILAYILARALVIDAVVGVLPAAIRLRVGGLPRGWKAVEGRAWGWIVWSLWIGSLTHVVWDGFTHFTSPLVQASDFLQFELTQLGTQRLEVFNLLQHGSTVVGLVLLAHWLRHWMSRAELSSREVRGEVVRRLLLAGVVGVPIALGLAGMTQRLIAHGITTLGFTTGAMDAGFRVLPSLTFAILGLALIWPVIRGRFEEG